MSNIEYLENPVEKKDELKVFVKVSELKDINMNCNGAESCCDRRYAGDGCGMYEGDCDTDNDCQGGLVCGKNNCLKYHSPGGHWDETDDCCERLCSSENVCEEGQGTCMYDYECSASTKCGYANCHDNTYFPENEFTLTRAFYNSSENCCYRPCHRSHNRCGHNELGCLDDRDCKDGFYCKQSSPKNYCEDINECLEEGKRYCGLNSYCTNTVGSFSCSCNSGYTSFVANVGCSDYNECNLASEYCPYGKCVNYDGGYQCLCNAGFTQVSLTSCSDINECTFDEAVKSCPTTENPGCYNRVGYYTCHPRVILMYYGIPYSYKGSVAIWNFDKRRYEGVCDYLWSKNDGDVVCKSLGYSYASSTYRAQYYGNVAGYSYYTGGLGCVGTEKSILDCPVTPYTCTSYYAESGVYCV